MALYQDLINISTLRGGKPVFLGITGYGRSGKDTVAYFMEHQWDFRKISLAEPIKKCLTEMTGEWFHTEAKHREAPLFNGATFRDVMISFGDWARSYNEDIFVDILRNKAWSYTGKLFVVPDIRRENELKLCDATIRVVRPGVGPAAEHPSEGELDKVQPDYTIVNDGTLDDLHKKVTALMEG
jgi:hypothetical protein